jgi:hypothetical protein
MMKYFNQCLNQLDLFNYVANQSIFLKIKDITSHAIVQKFLNIQILAVEGFKLSACLCHLTFHSQPFSNSLQ